MLAHWGLRALSSLWSAYAYNPCFYVREPHRTPCDMRGRDQMSFPANIDGVQHLLQQVLRLRLEILVVFAYTRSLKSVTIVHVRAGYHAAAGHGLCRHSLVQQRRSSCTQLRTQLRTLFPPALLRHALPLGEPCTTGYMMVHRELWLRITHKQRNVQMYVVIAP